MLQFSLCKLSKTHCIAKKYLTLLSSGHPFSVRRDNDKIGLLDVADLHMKTFTTPSTVCFSPLLLNVVPSAKISNLSIVLKHNLLTVTAGAESFFVLFFCL